MTTIIAISLIINTLVTLTTIFIYRSVIFRNSFHIHTESITAYSPTALLHDKTRNSIYRSNIGFYQKSKIILISATDNYESEKKKQLHHYSMPFNMNYQHSITFTQNNSIHRHKSIQTTFEFPKQIHTKCRRHIIFAAQADKV